MHAWVSLSICFSVRSIERKKQILYLCLRTNDPNLLVIQRAKTCQSRAELSILSSTIRSEDIFFAYDLIFTESKLNQINSIKIIK